MQARLFLKEMSYCQLLLKNGSISYYLLKANAAVMGLGELAAFLRLFAKRGTAYPNPNS
jgi:hypothetical protein